MYEGYFLEADKYLAAARFAVHFFEDDFGGEEERQEALEHLERVQIVIRDLIETLRYEE